MSLVCFQDLFFYDCLARSGGRGFFFFLSFNQKWLEPNRYLSFVKSWVYCSSTTINHFFLSSNIVGGTCFWLHNTKQAFNDVLLKIVFDSSPYVMGMFFIAERLFDVFVPLERIRWLIELISFYTIFFSFVMFSRKNCMSIILLFDIPSILGLVC